MIMYLTLKKENSNVKDYCISECEYGMHIQNKTCVQCGHCKGGVACNKSTGRCDNGCENHWNGDFCNSM